MTFGTTTILMSRVFVWHVKVWGHDRTLIQEVKIQGEDEAIRHECNELLFNIKNATKVTYEILSQAESTTD